jgi:hypothetical protein
MSSAEELQQIAVEGYAYCYPLLIMELTRRQQTVGTGGTHGPPNALVHVRSYPTADFREVVRPNFDTLYSVAWLDVRAEPVVVHAPVLDDRFFMLPMYDMWTEAFACPGSRTSGRVPITFALCTPEWSGALPEGVERIDAPTPVVWMIGRTQTNGPADYQNVHRFQDGMSITPLSLWPGPAPTPALLDDSGVDRTEPPKQVAALTGPELFALAAELVAQYRPHATDWSQLTRLARLGFRVGEPFDASAQPQMVQDAIAGAPAAARDLLLSRMSSVGRIRNGWMIMSDGVGVFGNAYVKRAIIARLGLGANPPEDAIYPILQTDAHGAPLDGANRYAIHFDAGELPPADAFWSITVYDAQGYQVGNELDRFAIGDRDDLVYNADGSLDVYLQHERPADELLANWLPAPAGPLGVTMRIYEPRQELFSGAWVPPPVRRVE